MAEIDFTFGTQVGSWMKQVKFGDSEMTGCESKAEESKPKYLKFSALMLLI